MVDLPRRELAVPIRTALPVWVPVVIAGLVALTLGVLGGLHGGRAVLAAVGVIALAVSGVAVAQPPMLVLEAEAFSLHTPLGERWRVAWHDCDAFRTWRGDVVVWESAAEVARHPRRAAGWRRRAQADAGIVAQFGGLSAADLAALLNRYRAAAPKSQ